MQESGCNFRIKELRISASNASIAKNKF